ncbi:DUF1801 domain-containing protein [Aurantiacibacter poecillastricola]|uniref:DUF1801 domain-containing protein n=1 Tax=Aurantiacibacter poecillastricola TaxID=3064385 RepID=UPI00273E4175|nr:DUF1801 domain-containing protein [Aurantiacibacter sp. 219JJ12-13]MDP5261672.1 DUF1801 domain-containing protein [Aurantiacibacter sp. 219JJ12-13]
MSENSTLPTDASVDEFIDRVDQARKREEARELDALFRKVTGKEPVMWGPSIIGYGSYHYKYDSGREGDMCRTGFSPRKAKHSIYLMAQYCDEDTQAKSAELLERLGKYSQGASCLYINKLADVDMAVLEEMIALNWQAMNRKYPPAG